MGRSSTEVRNSVSFSSVTPLQEYVLKSELHSCLCPVFTLCVLIFTLCFFPVSRLHCESESFKMDLILDVNTQIYPVDLGVYIYIYIYNHRIGLFSFSFLYYATTILSHQDRSAVHNYTLHSYTVSTSLHREYMCRVHTAVCQQTLQYTWLQYWVFRMREQLTKIRSYTRHMVHTTA